MARNRKIRVLILAPGQKSEGGIRSVISRILPHIESRDDIDVTWLGTHRTGSAPAKFVYSLGALLKSLIFLPRTDIVHVHGSIGPSLIRKSVFIWLSRLFRCRVIFHFHATMIAFSEFFNRRGVLTSYCRATLRQCRRIAVLSDSWRTVVEAALPDNEVAVIYNPVMEVAQSQIRAASGESRILYLAHLVERKGYQDLINAFAEVSKDVESARLIFCGTGDEERAQDMCRELGIVDRVEFHGWISDTEKVDELARTTVFCLPSYDEGLPMGVLEAMSFGLAIATTPVGGIPDVLSHEENALLFDAGDVAAMAEALRRLLLDSDLRQSVADKALRDSVEFRPGRIAGQWVRLYASVLDQDDPRKQMLAGTAN
jgi:glycosyltransferase involved in cell wall biosynthesis